MRIIIKWVSLVVESGSMNEIGRGKFKKWQELGPWHEFSKLTAEYVMSLVANDNK
jgi:hypothetical protein